MVASTGISDGKRVGTKLTEGLVSEGEAEREGPRVVTPTLGISLGFALPSTGISDGDRVGIKLSEGLLAEGDVDSEGAFEGADGTPQPQISTTRSGRREHSAMEIDPSRPVSSSMPQGAGG